MASVPAAIASQKLRGSSIPPGQRQPMPMIAIGSAGRRVAPGAGLVGSAVGGAGSAADRGFGDRPAVGDGSVITGEFPGQGRRSGASKGAAAD